MGEQLGGPGTLRGEIKNKIEEGMVELLLTPHRLTRGATIMTVKGGALG